MINKKLKVGLVSSFIIVAIFGCTIWFISNQKVNEQTALIQETSFESKGFAKQWPLINVDNDPSSFMVRLVLEKEVFFGSVNYHNYIIPAWNYGLYKDKFGKIQRVAIPRAWLNINQKKFFFPSSINVSDLDIVPSQKFFQAVINNLDENQKSQQRLVGVYISPNDTSLGDLIGFYQPAESWMLPKSFLETGSVSDLPVAPQIGSFLPITQLMFDISR